ncbi:serine/threonine-protein kinase Kist-like [Oratosquilla oratoria]|uniref:serine/threonine-protein kinase Kist-like n=1 Tax=Oratosquilla oratoria TaxID=337810 RepID=UPI003F760277
MNISSSGDKLEDWENFNVALKKMSQKYEFKELHLGQTLHSPWGRYNVISGLDVGRCCEVYEAEEIKTGDHVALKVFKRSQEYLGALQRELLCLRTLSVPNGPIVNFLGWLDDNQQDILVLELMNGNLRDVLLSHENHNPSPWLVTTLTRDICQAILHLHKHEIVHADMKPPNVMWSAESSCFKLTDFGVSFITSEDYIHSIYSKGYQSPEVQAWNESKGKSSRPTRPGKPSDVWSLGCIIAEVMLGHKLLPTSWRWSEKSQPCIQILKEAFQSLSSKYSKEFLQEATNFLCRCLRDKAGDRDTATNLLSDPWLAADLWRPQIRDLILLPTHILRFINVADERQLQSAVEKREIEDELLEECGKCGPVVKFAWLLESRNFYVEFCKAIDAETAYQALTRRMYNSRTLVLTFFPVNFWQKDELF